MCFFYSLPFGWTCHWLNFSCTSFDVNKTDEIIFIGELSLNSILFCKMSSVLFHFLLSCQMNNKFFNEIITKNCNQHVNIYGFQYCHTATGSSLGVFYFVCEFYSSKGENERTNERKITLRLNILHKLFAFPDHKVNEQNRLRTRKNEQNICWPGKWLQKVNCNFVGNFQ